MMVRSAGLKRNTGIRASRHETFAGGITGKYGPIRRGVKSGQPLVFRTEGKPKSRKPAAAPSHTTVNVRVTMPPVAVPAKTPEREKIVRQETIVRRETVIEREKIIEREKPIEREKIVPREKTIVQEKIVPRERVVWREKEVPRDVIVWRERDLFREKPSSQAGRRKDRFPKGEADAVVRMQRTIRELALREQAFQGQIQTVADMRRSESAGEGDNAALPQPQQTANVSKQSKSKDGRQRARASGPVAAAPVDGGMNQLAATGGKRASFETKSRTKSAASRMPVDGSLSLEQTWTLKRVPPRSGMKPVTDERLRGRASFLTQSLSKSGQPFATLNLPGLTLRYKLSDRWRGDHMSAAAKDRSGQQPISDMENRSIRDERANGNRSSESKRATSARQTKSSKRSNAVYATNEADGLKSLRDSEVTPDLKAPRVSEVSPDFKSQQASEVSPEQSDLHSVMADIPADVWSVTVRARLGRGGNVEKHRSAFNLTKQVHSEQKVSDVSALKLTLRNWVRHVSLESPLIVRDRSQMAARTALSEPKVLTVTIRRQEKEPERIQADYPDQAGHSTEGDHPTAAKSPQSGPPSFPIPLAYRQPHGMTWLSTAPIKASQPGRNELWRRTESVTDNGHKLVFAQKRLDDIIHKRLGREREQADLDEVGITGSESKKQRRATKANSRFDVTGSTTASTLDNATKESITSPLTIHSLGASRKPAALVRFPSLAWLKQRWHGNKGTAIRFGNQSAAGFAEPGGAERSGPAGELFSQKGRFQSPLTVRLERTRRQTTVPVPGQQHSSANPERAALTKTAGNALTSKNKATPSENAQAPDRPVNFPAEQAAGDPLSRTYTEQSTGEPLSGTYRDQVAGELLSGTYAEEAAADSSTSQIEQTSVGRFVSPQKKRVPDALHHRTRADNSTEQGVQRSTFETRSERAQTDSSTDKLWNRPLTQQSTESSFGRLTERPTIQLERRVEGRAVGKAERLTAWPPTEPLTNKSSNKSTNLLAKSTKQLTSQLTNPLAVQAALVKARSGSLAGIRGRRTANAELSRSKATHGTLTAGADRRPDAAARRSESRVGILSHPSMIRNPSSLARNPNSTRPPMNSIARVTDSMMPNSNAAVSIANSTAPTADALILQTSHTPGNAFAAPFPAGRQEGSDTRASTALHYTAPAKTSRQSPASAAALSATQQPAALELRLQSSAVAAQAETSPPSATRDVKVDASPAIDAEQLKQALNAMPQLNPDQLADQVYKSLMKRMKFEQRLRGF